MSGRTARADEVYDSRPGAGFHRRSQCDPHQRRHWTVLCIVRTPRMNAIARRWIGDHAATRH
jgi:hypothetical protein